MKGFTFGRHLELTLFPLSVTPEGCNPESSHRISRSNKQGFTLIELLVVVLIIGILASVALPQYQKAVLKSRAAEAWTNLKTLNTAAAAYCLENPSANESFSPSSSSNPLSVAVQDSKNFSYWGSVHCSDSGNPSSFAAWWHGGGGESFRLNIHPVSGYRTCADGSGSSCTKLGLTKYASNNDTICSCGGGYKDNCYYAD